MSVCVREIERKIERMTWWMIRETMLASGNEVSRGDDQASIVNMGSECVPHELVLHVMVVGLMCGRC